MHFPWHICHDFWGGRKSPYVVLQRKQPQVEDAFWHLLVSTCFFLSVEIFCLLPLSRTWRLWSECPNCTESLLHTFCHNIVKDAMQRRDVTMTWCQMRARFLLWYLQLLSVGVAHAGAQHLLLEQHLALC